MENAFHFFCRCDKIKLVKKMKKVMLIILDGYGLNASEKGNAVLAARKPNIDKLMNDFPCAELVAHGEEVGLPKGQMGNSEVGHMTIGSGRSIKQPLLLINDKIKTKEFFKNEELLNVINHVNENNSTLHIVGLLSNGGIHSTLNHFFAVTTLAKLKNIKNVSFHFITDGRDTGIKDGIKFIENFMEKIKKLNIGVISTISGRYYAMDRDNKWERTKKAYDAMVYGIGNEFKNYETCMNEHYKRNITDEYINPSIITRNSFIKENDGVIFTNFRPDRMRQIIDSLVDKNFKAFKVKKFENLKIASIFEIHKKIPYAYGIEKPNNTLGRYIDGLEYKQARIAETEKYAHVTEFFDGGYEFNSKNCFKYLIQSPNVPTYDQKPEMSLGEVTETVLKAIEEDYDFMLVNFANPDMVGHTGNFQATVDAIEICDFCLGKIYKKATDYFYDVIVTADHGNAEVMLDSKNNIVTTHTTNKVPFILCNHNYKIKNSGTLKDIAPTIIDLYEIKKPDEMTGESLIIKNE